jgi:type IV pilus assembly protein PilA
MKKVQQGFTLIELMIVIAIIGILAAIAIPAYSDYITRSKWADTLSNVASVKTAIGECMDDLRDSDLCNEQAELEKYGVSNTADLDGGVTTKYNATVTLTTTADIQLDGTTIGELAECGFTLTRGTNGIATTWTPVVMSSSTDAASCTKYVKGATTS